MHDRTAMTLELQQARLARLDAEAAGNEVEELIAQVQGFQPGKQRMLFMIDGFDLDPPAVAA